jgi:hypothetical protein
LEFTFECPQGRINLCNSRLVIEIVSPQFSLLYGAAQFQPTSADDGDGRHSAGVNSGMIGVAIQDERTTSSLVVVNSTQELLKPEFRYSSRDGEAPLQLGTVASSSVVEFPLDEGLCKNAEVRETLWGPTVAVQMWGSSQWGLGGTASYMLFRDPVSKRPISVCTL